MPKRLPVRRSAQDGFPDPESAALSEATDPLAFLHRGIGRIASWQRVSGRLPDCVRYEMPR